MPYRFGAFELRPENLMLFRDGASTDLKPRTVDLLRVLVEQRSRTVESDELLRLAWPRLAVGEGTLASEVATLRRVLGAGAISGGAGRGYRFALELDGNHQTGEGQRRQATVLNTDFASATKGDRRIEDSRVVLRSSVSSLLIGSGGRLVDSDGAIQVEFATAPAALQCAMAIQHEQVCRAASLPDGSGLAITIGLDSGDLQSHAGAVRGDSLIVAARLRMLGEPGGVCISGTVFDKVQSVLGDAYRYAGEQPVNGVARPVRVYHVGADGPPEFPASTTPGRERADDKHRARDLYRFGACEVRPALRQLLIGGVMAKVGARALDILLLLIENRDRVVSRSEVFDRVWPRSVVVEGNLQVHVFALRKLLGTHVIATIPGRGYRFTADLEIGRDPREAPAFRDPIGSPARTDSMLGFRSNLPEPLDHLCGRESDLEAVNALLSQRRLVTITGAGGIGKTRLAQCLAVGQQDRHRNGVCWVDLGSVTHPSMVPSAIGSALGVPLGQEDALATVFRALKTAQVLVVLDNAEHVIEAVASLTARLLDHANEVRLLVTSQTPLRSPREVQYRLGAMGLPAHDGLSPDEALSFGAVELFVRRAKAVERHFVLDEHTLGVVIDVCRQLDATPLAIEMAAARVGTFGLGRLTQSLHERLRLLKGGAIDVPERQRTLRATMQWSCSLLQAQEMVVFRRLGVFMGGFSLELAQRVAADPDAAETTSTCEGPVATSSDEWAVMEHLSTLVDRSLVAVDAGEYPRYRLLETARLFAREQLDAAHETSTVESRLAQAILASFTHQEEEVWKGRIRVDTAIGSLEPDLANFREALKWSIEHDAEMAVGLASTLEHSVSSGRMEEMLSIFDATEPVVGRVGETCRARWALAYARNLSAERGSKARRWAEHALEIYSRTGPPDRRYLALAAKLMCDLGGGGSLDGEDWQALRNAELKNLPSYVRLVGARARAFRAFFRGEIEEATFAATEVLALAERCGASLLVKSTKVDLAEFARCAGRLEESGRLLADLIQVLNPVRECNLAALVWINLLGTRLTAGELEAAREAALRASELCAAAQVQHWWADGAALLAAQEGRPRSAARLMGYADAIYRARSFVRQPNELALYRLAQSTSMTQLSAEVFGALLSAGASLSDEDAISAGLSRRDY